MNSGLDTESIVRAMGMATQMRINNNKRRVLQLQAQQNAYRDVISKFQGFRDKYFNVLNQSTFLRSATVFNQTGAKIFVGDSQKTPTGVSVTTAANATVGSYEVELLSKASQARVTGTALSTTTAVDLDAITEGGAHTLTVTVGTTTRNVVFNVADGATDAQKVTAINNALSDTFGTGSGGGLVSIDINGKISSADRSSVFISDITKMSDKVAYDLDGLEEGRHSFILQVGNQRQQIVFDLPEQDDMPDAAYELIKAARINAALTLANNNWAGGNSVKFEYGELVSETNNTPIAIVTTSANQSATVGLSSTMASLGVPEGEIDINGTKIQVTENMTVNQFMTAVNNSRAGVNISFSSLSGGFTMTSRAHGADAKIEIEQNAITDALGLTGNGVTNDDGKNMLIEINGHKVETTSNSYTIDGVTFEFATNAKTIAEGGEKFVVEVSRDAAPAANAIKSFVEDYNKMIEDIFGMLNQKPNRLYHFLTDSDMEEMALSDRQISQWEDRAKEGLLHRNSAITNIMGRMRMAMLTTVPAAGGGTFSIFDIRGNNGARALQPVSDFAQNGKLSLDEKALMEALERNPDEIIALFTDSANGIMKRLSDEIDHAISTSVDERGNPRGILIQRAGLATGLFSTKNALLDRINSFNKMIDSLQARYDRQQDRHWKTFSAMEKQFAALNSQSSQLAGMFSNMWG
jgi:flagellar capping protein FliD